MSTLPKLLVTSFFLASGLPALAGAPMGGSPVKATAPRPAASAAKAQPAKPATPKPEEKKDPARK